MPQRTQAQTVLVMIQRVVLGLGVVYGLLPFLTVPFLFLGGTSGMIADSALLFNGLAFLPACLIAFWFRRVGCILMCMDGALMLAAALSGQLFHPEQGLTTKLFAMWAFSLSVFLLLAEFRRWPSPLKRA